MPAASMRMLACLVLSEHQRQRRLHGSNPIYSRPVSSSLIESNLTWSILKYSAEAEGARGRYGACCGKLVHMPLPACLAALDLWSPGGRTFFADEVVLSGP